MGSYTFKWAQPADEVYVTGTFDNWTKSVKLNKEAGVFQKEVKFKDASNKIYYKFVVDNNWVLNESAPKEPDLEGNVNNFLTPEQIAADSPETAVLNTTTPTATTAAMAGEQPIQQKSVEKPAAAALDRHEETPVSATVDAPVDVPAYVPADTDDVEPKATPSDIPGGFPITPAFELDKPISISPLPAAEGAVNPITLAPGEKVPEHISAQSTTDNVRLDKESYEKSDALPGITDLPPVLNTTIPESSLPMVDANNITIDSVTPNATTAALAAEVPFESKVPEVVKESQEKAHVPPEASALPEEVYEKSKVEEELKQSVPEAPSTSEGTAGLGTEKKEDSNNLATLAATTGGAVIAAAISTKDTIQEKAGPAVNNATEAATEAANNNLPDYVKEQLPVVAQETLASHNKEDVREEVSPEVPVEVKESLTEAGKSPEAAASTAAVEEKKEVEAELLKEVKPVPAVDDFKPEGESQTAGEAVAEGEAKAKSKIEEVKSEVKSAIKSDEPKTEAPMAEAPKIETAPQFEDAPRVDEVPQTMDAPKTEAVPAYEPVAEASSKPATESLHAGPTDVKTETAPANGTQNGTRSAETTSNKSPSPTEKKKNRLSAMFSKIKHKLSDKK